MTDEPTLEQIEDYNNQESTQKRKTVQLVIVGVLIIGAIYSFVKYQFNSVDDYIGTTTQPGVSSFKY